MYCVYSHHRQTLIFTHKKVDSPNSSGLNPLFCYYFFLACLDKKASAGSGGFPGGQSNQLPGSRHHHAGGAEAVDVPKHPERQAARERQPTASTDLQ